MTAIPINKSLINFEDDFTRESFTKVLFSISQNHKHIQSYLHFDVLQSQKLMIKIQNCSELGSLKDLLYKSNPLDNFNKKYPNKGKGLHPSQISLYGKQILDAMTFLHANKWYHMHLHIGNVLLESEYSIKISELENFVNDLPIRNEHFFNYAYENFNHEHYLNKMDYNSSVLSEIFKNNFNIFEKIDIISFGRIIYELTTGRELKAPYPDDLEYKDMNKDIADILQIIYNKKVSKVNSNYLICVPDITMQELSKLKFFNNEDLLKKDESKSYF